MTPKKQSALRYLRDAAAAALVFLGACAWMFGMTDEPWTWANIRSAMATYIVVAAVVGVVLFVFHRASDIHNGIRR